MNFNMLSVAVAALTLVAVGTGCGENDGPAPLPSERVVTIYPEHEFGTPRESELDPLNSWSLNSRIFCVTNDPGDDEVFPIDITDYPIPPLGELVVDEITTSKRDHRFCRAIYELTDDHLLVYLDAEIDRPLTVDIYSRLVGGVYFSIDRDTDFQIFGTLDIDDAGTQPGGAVMLVALAQAIDEPEDAPADPKEIDLLWAYIGDLEVDSSLSIAPPYGGEFEIYGSTSGTLTANQLYRFYFLTQIDGHTGPGVQGSVAQAEIRIEFFDRINLEGMN